MSVLLHTQISTDSLLNRPPEVRPQASSISSLLIQSLTVEPADKSALIVSPAAPIATLATTEQRLSG